MVRKGAREFHNSLSHGDAQYSSYWTSANCASNIVILRMVRSHPAHVMQTDNSDMIIAIIVKLSDDMVDV